MGRYVEKNLYEKELIVEEARKVFWGLLGRWILGILFFWVLFIPLIIAIVETIKFTHIELVLTNRRIVYKRGVFHTKAFDVPLDKIIHVYAETTFWGRIFNCNKIVITTEQKKISYVIQNADDFKSTILGQIDQFEEERLARQATWTAQAMVNHGLVATKPTQHKKKKPSRYD